MFAEGIQLAETGGAFGGTVGDLSYRLSTKEAKTWTAAIAVVATVDGAMTAVADD